MEDTGPLPNRSEIGSKVFSPFVDRFSLIILSIAGIFCVPIIESVIEPIFGGNSFSAVVCGLIITIPLIASSIGKMYVRIRA
jgi:hypothetical protein